MHTHVSLLIQSYRKAAIIDGDWTLSFALAAPCRPFFCLPSLLSRLLIRFATTMSAFLLRTRRSRLVLAVISIVCISAFAIFHYRPTFQQELPTWHMRNVKFRLPKSLQRQQYQQQQSLSPTSRHRLPCSNFTGADEVVYVIKTGATEVYEKLPVHFNTTLKCPPNSLIFSDFAETLDGHEMQDALANITSSIQQENPDFDLWRRLHQNGRAALDESELSTHDTADPNGGGGNPENNGWRLDKFKNLPMVQKTFTRYPDKKWYLFTDADTYIVWSNLLTWTAMMDPTQKLYLGSQAVVGDQVFGHGGSGYILSHAAMAELAALYSSDQEYFDQKAADHWAGDVVLAEALEHELNITLTWTFPVMQGGDPDVQDFSEYGYDRQLWC